MSEDQEISDFKMKALTILEEMEKKLFLIGSGGDSMVCFNDFFKSLTAPEFSHFKVFQKHVLHLETQYQLDETIGRMHFSEVDYFLSGIKAAKKILHNESIDFDYSQFNVLQISVMNENRYSPEELTSTSVVKPHPETAFIVGPDSVGLQILYESLTDLGLSVFHFEDSLYAISELENHQPSFLVINAGNSMYSPEECVETLKKKKSSTRVLVTVNGPEETPKNLSEAISYIDLNSSPKVIKSTAQIIVRLLHLFQTVDRTLEAIFEELPDHEDRHRFERMKQFDRDFRILLAEKYSLKVS